MERHEGQDTSLNLVMRRGVGVTQVPWYDDDHVISRDVCLKTRRWHEALQRQAVRWIFHVDMTFKVVTQANRIA